MSLITPTIEQGFKQTFENNFYELAQQTDSYLAQSPAVKYITAEGNKHNISRSDKTELISADTRNPQKQYIDLTVDNRELIVKRFTRTFLVDNKDAQEMIADPKSTIYSQLMSACARTQDRVCALAATADVQVGRSDTAKTTITADADGVINIDATTGGLTYAIMTQGIENFINNEVLSHTSTKNLTLAITGSEHTDLMNEDKFINNDYTSFRPVDTGTQERVNGMTVIAFAGSVNGGIQVSDPILPEVGLTRKCLLLAPESIAMVMRLKSFRFEENEETYVDSSSVTVVVETNAIRYEGAKVQTIETTI